jgi:hypothetical protein
MVRYISCLEYIDIMHKLYKLRNSPWSSVAGNDADIFPHSNLVWLYSVSPLEIYLFILILSPECRRQQLYYLNLISFIYLGLFLTFL